MADTGSADGRARGVLLAAVAAVAVAALGVWLVPWDDLRGGDLRWEDLRPGGRGRTVLTLGISLVPDATGTLVEVVGESADTLPDRLDLELVTTDDAALVDGAPSTGQRLRYSDVRDGLGNVLPADQVRSGRLRDVGTDGRRLRLTFHVAAVGGRRIVYPIPRSEQLGWVRARLYVPTGKVTCWGDAPSGTSAFGHCLGPTGADPNGAEIDGVRHASIRLELET